MATAISWIVRYVDKRGALAIRTFYSEEAATDFMLRTHEAGCDVRSWAKVTTAEQPRPKVLGKPTA